MTNGAILQQAHCALILARKDLRIYYAKGPVIIFGILFPLFLFLAFAIGRHLTLDFTIPGLLGMILFFTSTSISPVVAPWEAQSRTLERLMCCPVRLETIILGDILASFGFGLAISLVPLILGLSLGLSVSHPFVLALALILAAFCFSSLGSVFSIPPTNMPSTVQMVSGAVKLPIIFISGIFIPLDELPLWGQVLSYFSPLTYFVDLVRASLQGQGHLPPLVDLLALLAFTALFLIVALRFHRRTMPQRL
ncbi:MAG: ABC transporter permease [Deltaproteobacteria bacterium]|nr:MAG: ABC transporter permease [Deltaproteobacteria bacterium]